MLFNSVIFLVFAIVFFGFWRFATKSKNFSFLYIILFSFIFYGWWNPKYLILIIGSGCIDFVAGYLIYHQPNRKRALLLLSIAGNLGSLAIFKYGVFFAENVEGLSSLFGMDITIVDRLPLFLTVLPVGISFYTFQSMSYTFDIYRGELKPTSNILHFFAYLSMFPQLVAGPIVRARNLLEQLNNPPNDSETHRWKGTQLIATGFFMKVVLADNLAPFINRAFADFTPSENSAYWWLIIIAFAFQIYFDFAGYSRIARGLAYWMGYEFPKNFDHPYIATSLQDFWRRWHITLSTWFRDYVYIPLGGSRKGIYRTLLNLWVVMIVSGLWHGPAWNFVIWGAVHAIFYSFEQLTSWPRRVQSIPILGTFLSIIITMIVVLIAWVFFRASDTQQALNILGTMLRFNMLDYADIPVQLLPIILLAIGFEGILIRLENLSIPKDNRLYHRLAVVGVALLLVLCVFLQGSGADFIYFQF